jgi:hypothetical protein
MTYKETLFFVAQCLTITLEKKNRILIEEMLQAGHIDWEAVVKVSTSHYVMPALYCNLKRVGYLNYLPEDLVAYMKHITELNRERNLQIIQQAKELNELLVANDITPVFLKGTGNLLEGLYKDIAERMVGDIDFIVSKDNYPKAIEVLRVNKYQTVSKKKYFHPSFKHHPRLKKRDGIGAVEIHKELLKEKYALEFNFDLISKDVQELNEVSVLGFEDQLALSIIAKQINDDGLYYKNMALRNGYDVFLLSKKIDAKHVISKFKTLRNPLNCFLASCYITFGNVDSLAYKSTKETNQYVAIFNDLISNSDKSKARRKRIDRQLFIKSRLGILYKSIFDKEHRVWLFKRIADPDWQQEKLVQLGLKKKARKYS